MMIMAMCPEHIRAVKALLDRCFGASSWSREAIKGELGKADAVCLIAVEDGRVIGFLAFEQVLDEGSIIEVAVHPDYRRRGIARQMIADVINSAEHLAAVFLEVRESNTPAIALYESLGFGKISIRKDYYDHPKENAVVYQRSTNL